MAEVEVRKATLEEQRALEKWQRRIGAERSLATGWEVGASSYLATRYIKPFLQEATRVWSNSKRHAGRQAHVWGMIETEESMQRVALEALMFTIGSSLLREGPISRNRLGSLLGKRSEYALWLRHPVWGARGHLNGLRLAMANDMGMEALMRRLTSKGLEKAAHYKPFSKVERIALGTMLLEVVAIGTGLIEIAHGANGAGRRAWMVKYTKKYWDFLGHWREARQLWRVSSMPMVVPPLDWTGLAGGGYRTILREVVNIPAGEWGRRFDQAKPCVLGSLNYLQQQKLHLDHLQVRAVEWAWEQGHQIGEMPSRNVMAEPNKKEIILSGGEASEYWERFYRWRADVGRNGARSKVINTLVGYQRIKDFPEVYYAWRMDRRGRFYPMAGGLNYQEADHYRSMVEFKEQSPIKGNEDIFAWCLGEVLRHEKNFPARLRFLQANSELLGRIGTDPQGTMEHWTCQKDPWQFLKLCRDWAGYLQDPGYTTGTVFKCDQTASGFGHLACLTRDGLLAAAACVVGDRPCDIYMVVATVARERMKEALETETDPKQLVILQWWLGEDLPRKLFKLMVMPYLYGRRYIGLLQTIRTWLYESSPGLTNEEGVRYQDLASLLAHYVHGAVREVVPTLQKLTNWLRYLGREQAAADQEPRWRTPNGMMVCCGERESVKKDMILDLAGRKVRIQTEEPDERRPWKVKSSVGADFVHSYEAAFLQRFVSHWSGWEYPIITVHDCYGTTLEHWKLMRAELQDQWLRFYSEDHLASLHRRAQLVCGKEMEKPPCEETLDVKRIGENQYLFT